MWTLTLANGKAIQFDNWGHFIIWFGMYGRDLYAGFSIEKDN